MKTIKISNVPAGARALAHDLCAGGVVDQMCAHGLVIGDSSLEFPDYLLNSLTWTVNWKWEIFDDDRDYLEPVDRNEMNALARLKDRLTKMGGVDQMELTDDGEWIDGFGPRVSDSSDVDPIKTTVTFSMTKTIALDVVDHMADNETAERLRAHDGGKITLPTSAVERIVIALDGLLEVGASRNTKARVRYTFHAVERALRKANNNNKEDN